MSILEGCPSYWMSVLKGFPVLKESRMMMVMTRFWVVEGTLLQISKSKLRGNLSI